MVVRSGAGRPGLALSDELAVAYNRTGPAWQRGPARVYDRLADTAADLCPVPFAGARVLDLGAGTGAAGRAAQRRGAEVVVALDSAIGMLAAGPTPRPPAVAGSAVALPFATASFDAVLAAFSLNHLTAPVAGLREAARVLRPGGGLVVASFAADDKHPARDAVASAAMARGWVPPPWSAALHADAVPLLATVEQATKTARAAGFVDVLAAYERIPFPELEVEDLVEWRMGMAELAPFVAGLAPSDRQSLAADAAARLRDAPMLVRSVVVLRSRAAG